MPDNNRPMLIGYHTNIHNYFRKNPSFDIAAKTGKGVDFILCHVDPTDGTLEDNVKYAQETAQALDELGVDFIANFEAQNFIAELVTSDGYDWANRPDGTHLLKLPKEYVDALNSRGNCMGLMYDELEHVIINRNLSISLDSKFKTVLPAFLPSVSRDPVVQGDYLSRQLGEYADSLKKLGGKTVSGEHVFPVLFHKFAKNGIIPNFKSQKESFSNVQFSVAAGAALQYGTPLWNCIDLWCRNTFPGHSPYEMYNNLVFSYLMGVDLVYVESSDKFVKDGTAELSEYGEQFCRFAEEYRGKERKYTVRDYKPEIGIIRYDDTFWGQGRFKYMWRNMLFGNPEIKADDKCREWIKVYNMITRGETGNGGIAWDRIELRSLTRHRSFATMNNAVVFDENVTEDKLRSLKLCFLCGYKISSQTLTAVEKLVKENGLTVVTSPRFAPAGLNVPEFRGFTESKDGKGTWIVTDNFRSKRLAKRLDGFFGKKGEMRFVFGDETVRLKIDENGDGFTRI